MKCVKQAGTSFKKNLTAQKHFLSHSVGSPMPSHIEGKYSHGTEFGALQTLE